MRVLSLASVFPNPVQPRHGVFVRERLRALAVRHEVTVVAPVPWFPVVAGRMLNRPTGVVERRRDDAIHVYHPRWLSPPALGKSLDGWLYAASVRGLIERLHDERRFDLIDAHFAYPDGFAAWRLARGLGLPVTVTLRGTLPDLAWRPSRRWALRRVLRDVDAVMAVSANLARDAGDLGLDPRRVVVTPNGIDTAVFRLRDRAEARTALGLPSAGPLVVSVGALRAVKGHHHLLQAIASLTRRRPDVRVAIVGGPGVSDDRSESLRRLARSLGIADRVIWAGGRPHEEVPAWLAASDAFALASRREGCCNALLEALACGRPVVATAVGGNPEIVTSPALGRLVPPADAEALAGALDDVLAITWDPEAIRASVLDRGWDRVAATVERVWEGVAHAAAHRPAGSARAAVEEATP